jgi:hypothetical protein
MWIRKPRANDAISHAACRAACFYTALSVPWGVHPYTTAFSQLCDPACAKTLSCCLFSVWYRSTRPRRSSTKQLTRTQTSYSDPS